MKAVKLLSVVVMAALFAVASVTGTALAAKTLKLHHLNKDDPFDNPTGAIATVFKSLVEAGTNGSVMVQTFPSGQLGKDKDALQQVKAGVIQAGIHSVGGFASVYPLIGILDVPFAFPNISKTYEVFDGPFGKKLAADIEKKTGMHVLGFGDSGGFFHLTNSKRPIHTPADIITSLCHLCVPWDMLRRATFIPFTASCCKVSKAEVFGPMVQIILVFRIVVQGKRIVCIQRTQDLSVKFNFQQTVPI